VAAGSPASATRCTTEPDPEWLLRDDVRRGLRAVADAGLAYDLLLRTRELPAAASSSPP